VNIGFAAASGSSGALDDGRVTFKEIVGMGPVLCSRPGKLVFPDDALMPVCLALDPVLQNARRFRQLSHDLEPSPAGAELLPVGGEADRLPNGVFI